MSSAHSSLVALLLAVVPVAGASLEVQPDPEVAEAAEVLGWQLEHAGERAASGARVAAATYGCAVGAGRARVVVYDELGAGGREVDWLQPEHEYHDGWITFGDTAARRDGRVAVEVAAALLPRFGGVAGTTLNLWEHPSEPYRFWVSIELAPAEGRERPDLLTGGTLTVIDGRLRMLDGAVALLPPQLEALAELALRRRAAGQRIGALAVRSVDAREVEPPFWPPVEVVLVTGDREHVDEADTAWLELLRLEQDGRLWRVEAGCIQRLGPGRRSWLLGDELGGEEVRLLRQIGPGCLTGAGPGDFEPAQVRLRGRSYQVVLGELAR